jgi:sensor histidine kinase YesM
MKVLSRISIAAAAWTLLAVFFSLPLINSPGGWVMALKQTLALWWSWGLLTPLIIAADMRLPFRDDQLGRRIVAHVFLSVVFTSLFVYVLLSIRAGFGLEQWSTLRRPMLVPLALSQEMSLWSWLIYWAIAGGWLAYRYYRRYLSSELRRERLERQFSEARLNALRLQLDPHFLFNALNTISSEVEREPRLARRMIEHLGDLLRLNLESKDRQEVPLSEEMAFLEHYLAIQKIRFGENLKVEVHVDPDVKHALVPSLVVQPLVENAIRHGISRRATGGNVLIAANKSGDRVEIRVEDDGVGLPAGWDLEHSAGLGLSVTRERIAGLHANGESSFSVRNRAGGGTAVEIVLPLKLTGEESNGSSNS